MNLRKDESHASKEDKGHQSFEAFARQSEKAQASRQETRQAGQQSEIATHVPAAGCCECGGLLSLRGGVIRQASGKETCFPCWSRIRDLSPRKGTQ
jgi:hypothetical protein